MVILIWMYMDKKGWLIVKKKDNYIVLIIICIILLSIVGIMYFDDNDLGNNNFKENEIILLDDYSRFFTINSCVYKYISFITSKSTDNILEVLDSDYIKNNNITKDNIYNHIGELKGNYSFSAKKIYYQEQNKNFIKYYIYGYLIEDIMGTNGKKEDYYIIVNLDLENELFSVSPYDGKIFKEGI